VLSNHPPPVYSCIIKTFIIWVWLRDYLTYASSQNCEKQDNVSSHHDGLLIICTDVIQVPYRLIQ